MSRRFISNFIFFVQPFYKAFPGKNFFLLVVILCSLESMLNAQTASLDPTLSLVQMNGVTVPYQNGIPLPSFEKQPRTTISLEGVWRKMRFNANHAITLYNRANSGYALIMTEAANRHTVGFDDSQWEAKSLPSVENNLLGYEKTPEYYESGVWYRRSFTVPDSLKQLYSKLMFYAVNYVCDVWLNGTYLGYHEGGYTPFAFDVSSILRTDTTNVIAVRVDNIPWGTRNDIVPFYTCDWFNYTGIIHDVYLEFANPLSVVRADVVPQNVDGTFQTTVVVNNRQASSADVSVALHVYRARKDSASLIKEVTADLIGDEVTVSGTTTQSLSLLSDSIALWRTNISISNPQLWSPRKPNLYILKVIVTHNNSVVDQFATQFAIRTVKASGNKFLLNGFTAFLHGVARHEDHPSYGRSVPKWIIYSDFLAIKSLNANFVRTAHYPNNPYTYLVADRLGLLIMEEIPVWWFDDPAPWALQNNMRHIHQQMFREMVFRDYNRPSIALWSTCNECKDVDGRTTFIRTVRQELNTLYPDGRLVAQSAAADRPGASDASQLECDVAAWTMYFGIFHGGTMFGGTKQFVADAARANPRKPIMDTEFGYWSSENGASQSKQVTTFDSTFAAFAPYAPIDSAGNRAVGPLMGVTWWCAFDWYTHQQTLGFESMGLIKMDRSTTKPVLSHLVSEYAKYVNTSEYITIAEIHHDRDTIDFGIVDLGHFKDMTFAISNIGNDTLHVSKVTVTYPKFTVRHTNFVVPQNGSFTDTLRFTANAVGTFTALLILNSDATNTLNDTIVIIGTCQQLTLVAEQRLPKVFSLSQNYPNPFNPSTVINYELPVNSHVSLKVYDVLGREVATLVDGVKGAGSHDVQFAASKLSSGVYFYRIQAGNYVEMRKMALIK